MGTAELAQRHKPVDSSIPLGSGGRFKKLKSKLAARGARNPGALAAYIGRRAYGKKKFASLGAKGRSHAHASTGPALEFAAWEHELRGKGGKWVKSGTQEAKDVSKLSDHQAMRYRAGRQMGMPHQHALRYGLGTLPTGLTPSATDEKQRVASSKTRVLKSYARAKSASYSNTGPALEFTVPDAPAFPVTGPIDLLISRDPEDGSAVVRHRRGGGEIGRIKHSDDGQWRAARDGKDLNPHTRQRGALLELIGAHNTAAPSPYRRQPAPAAEPPLQPRPEQTPLMKAYGIPAITLAASTPVRGASDGARFTARGEPDADDRKTGGLGPRGKTIYGKLRKRGFPHQRAHSFARRAERKAAG